MPHGINFLRSGIIDRDNLVDRRRRIVAVTTKEKGNETETISGLRADNTGETFHLIETLFYSGTTARDRLSLFFPFSHFHGNLPSSEHAVATINNR